MGTRHLITIVKDGEFKLAQYGQWDGYPSGQGAIILKFLAEGDVEALRRNVDKLYFAGKDDVEALYETFAGIPRGQEWIDMEQSKKLKENLPTLHRDTGARIFDLVAGGGANSFYDVAESEVRIPTIDMLSYAGGWDCEWVYAVDLDSDTFEVYEAGIGGETPPNRFTDVIKKAYEDSEEEPCSVNLVGSYKFDALPALEDFLKLEDQADDLLEADDDLPALPAPDADASDGDKPIWSM
ncbi:hypothetical protein D3C71_189160 [compost metagenome]